MSFAIVVKNNDRYDVIGNFHHKDVDLAADFNAAYDSKSPIIGMYVGGDLETQRQHKLTATYGSVWDGSSFSGGRPSKALGVVTDEELDSFELFVFLHNNVLIGRIGSEKGTEKTEMYKAAFAAEVLLLKVPDHQSVFAGETYGWNGTEFIPVE